MPELGYYFHAPLHGGEPGYPQLDITLFAAPTHRHYDPRQVTLAIAHFGSLRLLDIHHPWHDASYHVCPGRIVLRDFVDKPVVAFSFGGEARLAVAATCTRCTITSRAPIIHLIEEEDPATLLAEEFESLLARRRGAWAGKPTEYEARLIQADALQLYIACLRELREAFAAGHRPHDAIYHAVAEAIGALEATGRWIEHSRTLAQLL